MLWLAVAAFAQEPGSAVCARAIGGVGGLTFGRRDYDFTTPGTLATSGSPVLSQLCERIGTSGGPTQSVFWIGFDAMPLLLHSYNRFGERSPVWVEAALGVGRRYGRHIFGLQVVTNSATIGVGTRWVVRLPEKQEHGAPSLELKLAYYPAHDPELRATLLMHFASSHFDPRRNPMTPLGRRPASEPPPPPPAETVPWPETPEWPTHWDETDPDAPIPEPVEPIEPVEPPEPISADSFEKIPQEPDADPAFGFEIGSMMGLRADISWKKRVNTALRVGSLTSFRRDALLQPTALVTAGLWFGPAITVGTTRHDNVWMPVGGVAFVFGAIGGLKLHVGVLAGREFIAPDIATVVMW